MPSTIKILPDTLINKIAAGEVVERPASVVKELIENALDAGSTDITIEIERSGTRVIRVTDNGKGMSREDTELSLRRHATSKIASDADLEAIRTMGFRGEALSSIAAVARVRLVTAEADASSGTLVEIEGGKIKKQADAPPLQGTSVEVGHLFYNTPARLKFLKSAATEFSHILSVVSRQAMANRMVRFRLLHDRKPVLDLPPAARLGDRVYQVYGSEIASHLFEFAGSRDAIALSGMLSQPAYTRADRTYQDFFVNGRHVKNPALTHALYAAYEELLMRDRHPLCFVFLELDPSLVDVNVHPAKAEVRFRNQSQVHDAVRDAIREGMRAQGGAVSAAEEHARAVREALSDYGEARQEEHGPYLVPPKPRHSTLFFGRRRTDILPRRDQPEFVALQPSHPALFDLAMPGKAAREQVLTPLAQIHDSYILAESREGLVIVDQHAAHERVLYENLQDLHRSDSIPVQDLLIPEQLELGPAESALLDEHIPELSRLGFMVDDFGGGTFVIKAVPSLLVGGDYRGLLRDILDELSMHGKIGKITELRDRILSVMACHPAIKVNRRLDLREMDALLADLLSCRMPHSCPHGRPTMVRFSVEELAKMFKRT